MRKKYVLDTSALINDPSAYQSFPYSDVIIPIAVLNELDKLKKQIGETGKNARVCIRLLDELSDKGDISTGVLLEKNDILVKIDTNYYDQISGFGDPNYGDTQILVCAYIHWKEHISNDVTLVSNDINLRIKAKSRGLDACSHEKNNFGMSDLYAGLQLVIDEQAGMDMQNNGFIDPTKYDLQLYPNECVMFQNEAGDGIAMGRKVAEDKLKLIKKHYPWGLAAKNMEQSFAIDLIMDKNVDLITLTGKAGTGKSLIALAASLELVLSKREYDRLIIYRPIQEVGKGIGFLPGTEQEKLAPWFQAIMDSLEFLLSSKNKSGDSWKRDLEMFQKKGLIEMEAFAYIRGRSIPNSIIMIDECFPFDQKIEIEGGKKKIGILHKMFKNGNKMPLVKTFNEETGTFEYKKITNSWNRGVKPLLKVTCGNREIKCTENHPFLTTEGWKKANQLAIGDLVKTTEPNTHQILRSLNDDQEQIMLGSFLGDGAISNHGLNRFRLRVIHGIKQKEYCQWKADMFNCNTVYIEKNGYSQTPAVKFNSKVFGLKQSFPKKKTTCPQWILDKLDARGLAIWFMDDGSVNKGLNGARISTCSFNKQSQIRIVKKLKSLGINCEYKFHKMKGIRSPGYYSIILKKEGFRSLCKIIEPYIHNNIDYKIYKENVNKYIWNNSYNTYGLTVVDKITSLNERAEVFDIEVEDNHNFVACSNGPVLGGLIVHNCQNISKEDMKTLLTRAGENTKVILTGDVDQTDVQGFDAIDNGLTYVVEKFKEINLAGHMTFTQGERSKLATIASDIL